MVANQLMFQPPKFDWHSEDQQTAFKEWKEHISLALEASNIPQERWYASIIGFLGQEGFQHWQHLDISKDPDQKKIPENMCSRQLPTPLKSQCPTGTTSMRCTATSDRENKKPPIS